MDHAAWTRRRPQRGTAVRLTSVNLRDRVQGDNPSQQLRSTLHDDDNDSRFGPGARHRPREEVRRVRPALHVLSHRGPLPRGVHRRALRERPSRPERDPAPPAAVAVRAPAVLQHALLLLRLQQGHHQGPRTLGEVRSLPRARDRDDQRAGRRQSACRAAPLGRRHAHVPVERGDGIADAHAARRLRVRSRRRDLHRGRSAQGGHRERSPSSAGWVSTASPSASRTSTPPCRRP